MLADIGRSTIDPAYHAHALPLRHWSLAWWFGWLAPRVLAQSLVIAAAKLRGTVRTPWDKVTGPAAALLASIWRLGWAVYRAYIFYDDLGNVIDFTLDSPAAVARAVRESVSRWQARQAMMQVSGCIPEVDDFTVTAPPSDLKIPPEFLPPAYLPAWTPQSVILITAPLARLMHSKAARLATVPEFTAVHRPSLVSAVTAGQWPQTRMLKLFPEEDDNSCQLCKGAPGTLMHRYQCPATTPPHGWPAYPADASRFVESLSAPRRMALHTRVFLALRVPTPLPAQEGWCRWLKGSTDVFGAAPSSTASSRRWAGLALQLSSLVLTVSCWAYAMGPRPLGSLTPPEPKLGHSLKRCGLRPSPPVPSRTASAWFFRSSVASPTLPPSTGPLPDCGG